MQMVQAGSVGNGARDGLLMLVVLPALPRYLPLARHLATCISRSIIALGVLVGAGNGVCQGNQVFRHFGSGLDMRMNPGYSAINAALRSSVMSSKYSGEQS